MIVASGATDDFAGKDEQLAVRADGSSTFLSPQRGWRLWDETGQVLFVFDGTSWNAIGSEPNPSCIRINTAADLTNRLAVRSHASLFTAETDDHRFVINRDSPQANASLVLQTDYKAGAELGLWEGDFSIDQRESGDGVFVDGTIYVIARKRRSVAQK